MTERNGNQGKTFGQPPSWCSAICRNAMNEVCVENCAIKRDCSAFEEKPNLKLADMPPYPVKESARMTKDEKFTSVTFYLAKVVDHLQGNEDVIQLPTRRVSGSVRIARDLTEIAAGLKDGKENE